MEAGCRVEVDSVVMTPGPINATAKTPRTNPRLANPLPLASCQTAPTNADSASTKTQVEVSKPCIHVLSESHTPVVNAVPPLSAPADMRTQATPTARPKTAAFLLCGALKFRIVCIKFSP